MSRYFTGGGRYGGFTRWWDSNDWSYNNYGGRAGGFDGTNWWSQTTKAERDKIINQRKDAVRFRTNGSLPEDVLDNLKKKESDNTASTMVGTEYAGYDIYTFAMDVNGTFHSPTLSQNRKSIRSLHEVAEKGFQDNAMYAFEPAQGAALPSEARRDAAKHYKFLRKFPRTPLFQMLMAQADFDPDTATRLFFEGAGGGSNIDDLQELSDMNAEELGERGIGQGWDRTSEGMRKFLDVRELLRHIRRDWDFSGERTKRTRITKHPADDIRYRKIKSYAEVVRTPLYNFGRLDVLMAKLAQGSLQVREYEEHIPGPPKNFLMLIDDSGSMGQDVACAINGRYYSGIHWAIAIAIAIVQAAEEVDNKVTVGMFSTSVHDFTTGTAKEVETWLWRQTFNSGGTNIEAAVEWANRQHRKNPIEACMVITDGEDNSKPHPEMPCYPIATESLEMFTRYSAGQKLVETAERVILLTDTKVDREKEAA